MTLLHAIATLGFGLAGAAAIFTIITQFHSARWTVLDALLGQNIPAPRQTEGSDHGRS